MKLYRRLNICIVPEAAVHGFLAMLLLINGFWSGFFLNLPVLGWNIKKYEHNMESRRGRQASPRISRYTLCRRGTEPFTTTLRPTRLDFPAR